MSKVLVDFDAIGFRNALLKLKEDAHNQYLVHNKGNLGDKILGTSFESMSNAWSIALDLMEDYAVFEK